MRKIKHFLSRLRFQFYFDIYLITLKTHIMSRAIERMTYDICRLRFEICRKRIFEIDLYKTDRW